jgi:site-specific DNA-cytosine methylase
LSFSRIEREMVYIGIRVLSLFDGLSGGQIALNKLGGLVDKYYASEINPYSIKITQKNYPNTIQLGDVTKITEEILAELGEIDLFIFGSPCEDLSITKSKTRESLQGEKSKLFYEALRVKNIINPKWFMMENVASMNDESRDIITQHMQVEPILINSNILSAQDRERYYWTNIPVDPLPKDKGLVLKDIMEGNVDEKYYYNKPFEFHGLDKKVCATLDVNTHEMLRRVYNPNMKCATLTAVQGGYQEKKVYDNGGCRKLTPLEYERLQNVPEGYTEGVCDSKRYSMLGDGWTIDVICHIFKNLFNN